MFSRRALTISVAVVALVTSACGTEKAVEINGGPGVSANTLTLGVLTDMSGPFAPFARIRIMGYELFIAELNDRGGICGRKVELMQKDHGYDVQRALDGYFELEPQVLGFIDITGTPMTAAIAPDLIQSQALAAPASWSASLLGNPHMMVVGATYDLDVINGLEHLMRTGVIAKGDTIGHLYVEGDYGGNALEGSTFAAAQRGMTLAAQPVAETAKDLTAQVVALKAAGAKAVVLSTSPGQTATAVATADKIGWDAPFMVNAVGYDPAILKSPAAAAVLKRVQVVSSIAPYGADAPGPKAVAEAFKARHPEVEPTGSVNHGYAVGVAFAAVLEKACGAKDLSRDGVLRAFQDTTGVDTNGITSPLRFSLVGRPSATQSYIARPDAELPGGLAMVEKLFESDLVKLKGTRAK